MLVESKGIIKDQYFIPPFTLKKGEIVILFLFGGAHFYDLSMYLAGVFSGQLKHEGVQVNQPLKFVEHFAEPTFRRLLYPVTIGEYIRKKAGSDKKTAQKIFDWGYLNKSTPVNSLNGDRRKMLSLYTALSNSKNILLDLVGIDPLGAERVFEVVQEYVSMGGAAILLENNNEFKDRCTRFIELELIKV